MLLFFDDNCTCFALFRELQNLLLVSSPRFQIRTHSIAHEVFLELLTRSLRQSRELPAGLADGELQLQLLDQWLVGLVAELLFVVALVVVDVEPADDNEQDHTPFCASRVG